MPCEAKIRPLPNDTELTCEVESPGHTQHSSTLRDYAYPGSKTKLEWSDSDRRTFRGEWVPCSVSGCILPAGHHGRDAF